MSDRAGRRAGQLDFADLNAFVADFLTYLEQVRANSARTRNARLAAIRSFFRYGALCHPEHSETHRPRTGHPHQTRRPRRSSYLDQSEVDALLTALDRHSWTGRRDHALIDVVETGLRVSELTGLRNRDVELGNRALPACPAVGHQR